MQVARRSVTGISMVTGYFQRGAYDVEAIEHFSRLAVCDLQTGCVPGSRKDLESGIAFDIGSIIKYYHAGSRL